MNEITWPEAFIFAAAFLALVGLIVTVGEWQRERVALHDVDATLPDTGWITALAEETRTEEQRVDQAMRAGIEEGA